MLVDSLPRRIQKKISIDEKSCWNWTGNKTFNGYGRTGFSKNGKEHKIVAHKFVFLLLCGEYPQELTLDHLCRNRGCVNPAHLEPVTLKENHSRSPYSGLLKTKCPKGHLYSPENTFIHKRGYRFCRECQRVQSQKYYYAHRQTKV